MCIYCRRTFLAPKDRLDMDNPLPQIWICPYCKRPEKVKIIRKDL